MAQVEDEIRDNPKMLIPYQFIKNFISINMF